jgi:hypothetical protein
MVRDIFKKEPNRSMNPDEVRGEQGWRDGWLRGRDRVGGEPVEVG